MSLQMLTQWYEFSSSQRKSTLIIRLHVNSFRGTGLNFGHMIHILNTKWKIPLAVDAIFSIAY